MKVSCFCGMTFEADQDGALCPLCGEPASLPSLRKGKVDWDGMVFELEQIIDEHGVIDNDD